MYGRDLLPKIKATSKTDRYSENLMKWVERYKDRQLFIAIATEGKRSFDTTLTQAPYLYVGYGNLDDGYLMGSRLSEILCSGAKTSTFAYHGLKFVEVPEWWNSYIQHGKCFIDPEHELYMDQEHWEVSEGGKERKCLWCGNFTQYEHVELIPRKSWENVPFTQVDNPISRCKESMMKTEINDLKSQFSLAQSFISTSARNALTALMEGDEQECIDILKSLSGDE